jgi:hypothetical protein
VGFKCSQYSTVGEWAPSVVSVASAASADSVLDPYIASPALTTAVTFSACVPSTYPLGAIRQLAPPAPMPYLGLYRLNNKVSGLQVQSVQTVRERAPSAVSADSSTVGEWTSSAVSADSSRVGEWAPSAVSADSSTVGEWAPRVQPLLLSVHSVLDHTSYNAWIALTCCPFSTWIPSTITSPSYIHQLSAPVKRPVYERYDWDGREGGVTHYLSYSTGEWTPSTASVASSIVGEWAPSAASAGSSTV